MSKLVIDTEIIKQPQRILGKKAELPDTIDKHPDEKQRGMLYFPMDFAHLTIDGLVDTGSLTYAISEAD